MEHYGTLAQETVDHFIPGKKSSVSYSFRLCSINVSPEKTTQRRQGPSPACERFECTKNRAKKKRKQEREAKERVREQQHNLRVILHDHNYSMRREELVKVEQPRLLCTTAASVGEGEDEIPGDESKVVVSCVTFYGNAC